MRFDSTKPWAVWDIPGMKVAADGIILVGIIVGISMWAGGLNGEVPEDPEVNTYSVVAWDPETGDLGVAVQSKFFGVGSVVPWAEAGIGAIATQSYANTTFGPEGLRLLKEGRTAREAMDMLIAEDDGRDRRQVAIIDSHGSVAVHTGEKCMDYAGHFDGQHFSVQGNLLASEKVIEGMKAAMEEKKQNISLARRLVSALAAAEENGGDRRGRQSAAILVVRKNGGYGGFNDRFIDLRVEDHEFPVRELDRLLGLHEKFYRSQHDNPPKRSAVPEQDTE